MAAGRWLAGTACAAAALLYTRGPVAFVLAGLLVVLAAGGLSGRWGIPSRWRAAWTADAWTLGLVTPLATVNAYVAAQDRALTSVEASLYYETAAALVVALAGLVWLAYRLVPDEATARPVLLLPAAAQAAVLLPSAHQGDPRSILVALAGIYLVTAVLTTAVWAAPAGTRGWMALAGLVVYVGLIGVVTGGLRALFDRPSPVPAMHVLLSLLAVLSVVVTQWPIQGGRLVTQRRAARRQRLVRRPSQEPPNPA